MLERRYSRDHSWAERRDGAFWVGLTAHATLRLGRLMQLQFSVVPGQVLPAGGGFGNLESDKTVIELYTPVGGRVLAVNEALLRAPERLQEDYYGEGWLLRLEPGEAVEFAALLDASAYSLVLKSRAADL